MTKTSDEKSSKLKPYQMILLSCLLAAFMIINSNNVNYNRDLAKLNKEKGELFDRIIKTRRLSSSSSQTYSAEICERGSDDLKEYYQKGDPKIIDIDPHKSIECEDKDETYMKALINIVRTMADDTEEESDDTGGRRNLRNLGGVSDIDQQDLTDYGMRFLPMAVFLVFGILSIFGWIFCCICCCCDCCCCCCLKKTSCKVPCFIFTYVFYGLVVGISLYGLIQSNKIFVSLSDTECSILKFFEQVLNGEIKQSLPRWAGIEGIQGMLQGIDSAIEDMRSGTLGRLEGKKDELDDYRLGFNDYMKGVGKNEFYDASDYTIKESYRKPFNFPEISLSGEYIYDFVSKFGRFITEQNKFTPDSYLEQWYNEFSIVDGDAYGYVETALGGFRDILGPNSLEKIQKPIRDGKTKLGELTGPFTDANDEIGKMFSNASESIDKYGKLSVKVIFGALMAMNVALAALMLLICMFSGKSCTSCCCCRCLFKFCTHILWNVLALLMILSFILGSLIAFLGRFGGDAMGVVSYIMSIENFNGPNTLFLNRLNDAKDYLFECIHGNGDIASLILDQSQLNSFNDISRVKSDIESAQTRFSQTLTSTPTYIYLTELLEKQQNYDIATNMIPVADSQTTINNKNLINKLNERVPATRRKWDLGSRNTYGCNDPDIPEGATFYPKVCKPSVFNYDLVFEENAKAFEQIDSIIDYANTPNTGRISNHVRNVIDRLNREYTQYLTNYIGILDSFETEVNNIASVISDYSDPQNAFSFLNGKFIGINLQIILKYLKHSLGGDFFTVGICLCVVGLSLILSISSTIILIVIINIGLKEAIEQNKMINNPGTAVSPFEGVPNMPKPPY